MGNVQDQAAAGEAGSAVGAPVPRSGLQEEKRRPPSTSFRQQEGTKAVVLTRREGMRAGNGVCTGVTRRPGGGGSACCYNRHAAEGPRQRAASSLAKVVVTCRKDVAKRARPEPDAIMLPRSKNPTNVRRAMAPMCLTAAQATAGRQPHALSVAVWQHACKLRISLHGSRHHTLYVMCRTALMCRKGADDVGVDSDRCRMRDRRRAAGAHPQLGPLHHPPSWNIESDTAKMEGSYCPHRSAFPSFAAEVASKPVASEQPVALIDAHAIQTYLMLEPAPGAHQAE